MMRYLFLLIYFVAGILRGTAESQLPANTLFYTSLSGIGAGVTEKAGVPVISKVLPDSPAQRADLHRGDQILQVDEAKTAGMSLPRVVELLRGAEGTVVRLKVERDGTMLSFSIKRELMRFRRTNEATAPQSAPKS